MFQAYRRPTPPEPEPAAPPRPGPCVCRLHHDLRLHVAFRHLVRCGLRAVGFAVAEMLDVLGADPSCQWRALNPDLVAAFGGADFPRRPLDLVSQ